MNEHTFNNQMQGMARDVDGVRIVHDFEEAGVMTMNAGFVVTMHDGSEFQATIVKSR